MNCGMPIAAATPRKATELPITPPSSDRTIARSPSAVRLRSPKKRPWISEMMPSSIWPMPAPPPSDAIAEIIACSSALAASARPGAPLGTMIRTASPSSAVDVIIAVCVCRSMSASAPVSVPIAAMPSLIAAGPSTTATATSSGTKDSASAHTWGAAWTRARGSSTS